MTEQTVLKDLRALAPQLHEAHKAEKETKEAFKALEDAFKAQPEIAEALVSKKSAANEKKSLERKARALLQQAGEEQIALDTRYYRITPTSSLVLADETATALKLAKLALAAPTVFSQFLKVDMDALLAARDTNPIIMELCPDTEFDITQSHKTYINWSQLAQPELNHSEALVQLKAELAAIGDDFVAISSETTGINIKKDEPVKLTIIDQAGVTLMDTMLFPEAQIHPEAEAVHGISEADLLHAPRFADIADKVKALLEGKSVLAYNAPFAKSMIANAVRGELAIHEWTLPGDWHCLMKMGATWGGERSSLLIHQFRSLKFNELASRLGVAVNGSKAAQVLAVTKALQLRLSTPSQEGVLDG